MRLGWPELLVVLLIILIMFGAGKLSEIGSALGRSTKEFKVEAGNEEPNGALTATRVHPDTGHLHETRGIHTDQH